MSDNSNQFPDGKLSPDDDGALEIGLRQQDGYVRMDFFKAVYWLAMPPEQAIEFGHLLIRHGQGIIDRRR